MTDPIEQSAPTKSAVDLEILATAIRGITYNAYTATLVGQAPRCVYRLGDRIRAVAVGDLVVETTSIRTGPRQGPLINLDAVGYLEEIAWEPIAVEWDEVADGPTPTEKIYYIRTLDGRRFRWENANFISAPVDILPL